MSPPNAIADLEKRIENAYDAHSAKRVAMAALLVGVVSIGVSWATYYVSLNVLIVTGAFAVSSFLTVNIAMLMTVPPTKQLADSRALMIGALKDPMRIKSVGEKKVRLEDHRGTVRVLSGFEQVVWEAIVIPYFIKMSSRAETAPPRSAEAKASALEKKMFDKQQAELKANAKELLVERQKLNEERIAVEARGKELKKAQNQLEDRTSRMEASKSDLIRLKENLQRRMHETEDVEVSSAERALLDEKADELKAKELELEWVKQQLESDRSQLVAQQTNLQQMQGALSSESAPVDGAAQSKTKELEERESELEERLRYVANVENDLIDRLNQLSEREASIEQSEVVAGIRKD